MNGPPETVLEAFDLSDSAVLLPGGQGDTWRCGAVVLKRAGLPAEAEWRAAVEQDDRIVVGVAPLGHGQAQALGNRDGACPGGSMHCHAESIR